MTVNPRRVAALLFAFSLALRIAFAFEMAETPLFRHTEWRDTDNRFFADWAGAIADGDWLGREPLHPYHGWHGNMARKVAKKQGVPFNRAFGKAVWDDWYGGARFHQEPLYAYVLAAVKVITGDVRWAFGLQALAGAFSTLLAFVIARRLGGDVAGLVAAACHLLYGPFLFYDFVMHRTSLQTFGGLAAVWAILRAHDSGRLRDYAFLGAVLGLCTLLVSTALPLALVVAIVTAVVFRRSAWRKVGVILGTLAVIILPVVIRNVVLDVPPLEMSSVGAITFIDSNAADVDPSAGFFGSRHALDIMTNSGGKTIDAALATLRTHEGLGWFSLMAKKLCFFFAPIEIPNNESYAYYAGYSGLLGVLLGFHPFVSLFVIGLVAGLVRWRVAWPAVVQVLLGLAVTLAFYNLSRFRAPVLGAALPLIGLGLVELAGWFRERRWVPFGALILTGALPWVGLAIVGSPSAKPIRAADITVGLFMWDRIATDAGDPSESLEILERALDDGPDVSEIFLNGASRWSVANRRDIAQNYAEIARRSAALARAVGASPATHEARATAYEALARSLPGR